MPALPLAPAPPSVPPLPALASLPLVPPPASCPLPRCPHCRPCRRWRLCPRFRPRRSRRRFHHFRPCRHRSCRRSRSYRRSRPYHRCRRCPHSRLLRSRTRSTCRCRRKPGRRYTRQAPCTDTCRRSSRWLSRACHRLQNHTRRGSRPWPKAEGASRSSASWEHLAARPRGQSCGRFERIARSLCQQAPEPCRSGAESHSARLRARVVIAGASRPARNREGRARPTWGRGADSHSPLRRRASARLRAATPVRASPP